MGGSRQPVSRIVAGVLVGDTSAALPARDPVRIAAGPPGTARMPRQSSGSVTTTRVPQDGLLSTVSSP